MVNEFSGDEYASEYTPLPYLQLLNDQDPERSGFFISAENVEAAKFQAADEWQPYEARFKTGATVVGFRSLTARLVVLRRSPLLMFNRHNDELVGAFDRKQYNKDEMILKARYLIYLVSKQKQLLHKTPLQFTTKGSVCGSFGEHYNAFREEMSRAFGKPRGDRFFALSVFAVALQPELKGKKEKSWVCSITRHGIPTADNWTGFFLGGNSTIKTKLLAEFEAHADFGKPEQEKLMLQAIVDNDFPDYEVL